MFVDKPNRTNVDSRLSAKLVGLCKKKHSTITLSEAQILHRWYHFVPDNMLDNIDCKLYKTLERFIVING